MAPAAAAKQVNRLTAEAFALEDTGEWRRAIDRHGRAVNLDPDNPALLQNLARALLRVGSISAAGFHLEQAARLGDGEAAVALAHVRLDQGCTVEGVELLRRHGMESRALFYALHLDADHGPAHRAFAARLREGVPPAATYDGTRPLRVGYLSPHLCDHTVPRFLLPVLRNRTHHAICYNDGARWDAVTRELVSAAAEWRDVGRAGDAELANTISQVDRIDVLVDLAGHLPGARRHGVFSRRPAPLVVNYIGYPHDTGIPGQWRVSDTVADPPTAADGAGEKLIRLSSGCAWAFEPGKDVPEPAETTPAASNGYVTYGVANRACKVRPAIALLWGEILRRVAKARLRVLAVGGERNQSYRRMLEGAGVPADRLELVPAGDRRRYFAFIDSIDVALDTFPYNGMTTTCECLWQGVPVITLAGSAHVCRVGMTLLKAAGLEEYVATEPERYVGLAAAASATSGRHAGPRRKMRSRIAESAMCDGRGVTRAMEAAWGASLVF